MKKLVQKYLAMALIAAGLLSATLAVAGVGNVSNTRHNMSISGAAISRAQDGSGADQVCIFCHTPHNAGQTNLLWNKANNTTPTFRLYTSSPTLTNATRQSVLSSDSPSLLCLGCHDGKTAMNILHNSSVGDPMTGALIADGYPADAKLIPTNISGSAPYAMPSGEWNPLLESFDPSFNLGMSNGATDGLNLTDDHPIGFSYSNAVSQDNGGLNSIASMAGSGIRFFGANNIVECSTCHDPHVETTGAQAVLKPFLVKSNVGSGLCLTCHNK